MEDPARNKLRTMLGELLDHMVGAQEVASGIAQEYPEYGAMAEAVHSATEMVAMTCEVEAYSEREEDDNKTLHRGRADYYLCARSPSLSFRCVSNPL